MSADFIPYDQCDALLDWPGVIQALEDGHRLPPAQINDTFLYRGKDTLLTRSAWIDGLGILVKSATVFPGNPGIGKPTVNGGVSLYDDRDGVLRGVLDFHLLTKWKTAGDSALAASKLARPDSRNILIVGGGTVARSLRDAYASLFPHAKFQVWSRRQETAQAMVLEHPDTAVAADLEGAVRTADIVTCATMATAPLIRGAWLRPGQHIDLIGAYRADMREADDDAMARARLFVDSRDTTLDHIGELIEPLKSGAISRGDVVADFYDIASGSFKRNSDDEITLFKNGGGAHLDLMCAHHIQKKWGAR